MLSIRTGLPVGEGIVSLEIASMFCRWSSRTRIFTGYCSVPSRFQIHKLVEMIWFSGACQSLDFLHTLQARQFALNFACDDRGAFERSARRSIRMDRDLAHVLIGNEGSADSSIQRNGGQHY